MAEPVVLLDLDRTLLDTDRFMADMRAALHQAFDIDVAEFKQRYGHFRIVDHEGMRHYQFFRHIESYGLQAGQVEAELRRRLTGRGKDYAYADVAAFRSFLATQAIQTMVLTHGERRFQRLKFDCAPVLRDLRFRDVLTHKRQYIAQHFAGRQGILLDDAQVGQLPDGFRHVWISREQATGAYQSLAAVQADWSEVRPEA